MMIIIEEININYYKNVHLFETQPFSNQPLTDEGIDSASFASFEIWFQSIAPLNLKLPFRNENEMPFSGSVTSVS